MTTAKNEMIGVGVIGATGFIGSPYRREIRQSPGTRIVALCARRQDLLAQAAAEDGAVLATGDWREVVDHPEVDFVIVATPDALHYEAVMACAAAGKHLLCEKPVGANADEAYAMWDAYRERPQLAHFVPYWARYVKMFSRAREWVSQGMVGEVRSVIYRWLNPRPEAMPLTWRDDPTLSAGGSIADVGSHSYDTIRWVLGKEAPRVLAHGGTISPAKPDLGAINLAEALDWTRSHRRADASGRKGGTIDYANISWEFDDGVTGTLLVSHATHIRKGFAPDLELHGTEASLGVDRMTGELSLARPGKAPEVLETHPERSGNRFAEHVFPAVRAIMAGEPSDHPDLEDGYRVQAFTDAAAKAVELGRWVEVGTQGGTQ